MDIIIKIFELLFHLLDKEKVETVLMKHEIMVDDYLMQELKPYKNEHLGLFGNSIDKSIIIQAKGSAGKIPQAIGTLQHNKKLYTELMDGNLKAWVHQVTTHGIIVEFKFVKI